MVSSDSMRVVVEIVVDITCFLASLIVVNQFIVLLSKKMHAYIITVNHLGCNVMNNNRPVNNNRSEEAIRSLLVNRW